MELHPLNLAHQQHRRADAHLRYKRFDDAMQCHHNAAQLLIDAMKSTTSSVALESISLQHNYHLKQKDLIKSKKEQYERVRTALDNIRHLSKDPHADIVDQENFKIQIAIYRTIDESNTMLNNLLTKKIAAEVIHKNDETTDKSKSQQIVITELQNLGQDLHGYVEQLMTHVEVLKDENMTLKERVDFLEKERTKYLSIQSCELPTQNKFPVVNNNVEAVQRNADQPRAYMPARPQQPHFDLSAFKDD